MSETLYERDFYEWTREQSAALRTPGANNLDWENLAEEIEDLGASQLLTVFSYIRRIIEHLYKLADSQNPLPRNKWRREDSHLPGRHAQDRDDQHPQSGGGGTRPTT